MIKFTRVAAGLSLLLGSAVVAQTGSPLAPQTQTVVTPVAPPGMMATQVAPGAFVVTPVPGVSTATRVRVQKFADYDLNKNGVYSPMEFAQALYFMATSDPVAGNPRLPMWDRYTHRGAPTTMGPGVAVALLNATADEFAAADLNKDWRVSPDELVAISML